jgi:TRAP-type transport system periplasmic protein
MILNRRLLLAAMTSALAAGMISAAKSATQTWRLSAPVTATDQRALALTEVFGPAISGIAIFEPHWGATLVKQGTELDAIARGNLEMALTSAQEIANFVPEFSIFAAGYLHRDADHQLKVFAAPFMEPLKQKVEKTLGVKLLGIVYLGRRQLNLRTEKEIQTPADLAGLKLRMPGSDAWQFMGKALGAEPLPLAFTEVYANLSAGTIDGQDNPLPTDKDSKFYEVTKQIVLTSHLVDFNYLALSLKVWDTLTPEQQKSVQAAADNAATVGREKQLALEEELEQFFKDQGLKVYEPDVTAFRNHVQKVYLESDVSKPWPLGLLDKINEL